MGILKSICDDNGIPVTPLSEDLLRSLTSGAATETRGRAYAVSLSTSGTPKYSIHFDRDAGIWEQRMMVAHELGHVLFGHISGHCVLSGDAREREAGMFAGAFVALMLFKEYEGRLCNND